jgi:hypothetical protein
MTKSHAVAAEVVTLLQAFGALIELCKDTVLIDVPNHSVTLQSAEKTYPGSSAANAAGASVCCGQDAIGRQIGR